MGLSLRWKPIGGRLPPLMTGEALFAGPNYLVIKPPMSHRWGFRKKEAGARVSSFDLEQGTKSFFG